MGKDPPDGGRTTSDLSGTPEPRQCTQGAEVASPRCSTRARHCYASRVRNCTTLPQDLTGAGADGRASATDLPPSVSGMESAYTGSVVT